MFDQISHMPYIGNWMSMLTNCLQTVLSEMRLEFNHVPVLLIEPANTGLTYCVVSK